MNRLPTILDVAKHCGYSKSTVSLVLQESPEIPPETKDQVQKAIAHLGYRYNRFAGGLRTRHSHTVGMLIQDHLNPFYAELVHQVESILRQRGYDLIVTSSNTDLKLERHALERFLDHRVDSLILSALDYEKINGLLQTFLDRGVQCVIAGPPPTEIPFDSATVDLGSATMAAMKHLFNFGHRKIAFLWGAPTFQGIGGRFDVFQKALLEQGLRSSEDWIVHCGIRIHDGYEAARLLLQKRPRPSAIFALNDLLAIGVMSAATDLGLHIPRDLSVIGTDNVEISSYVRPALTTVSQPIALYAKALCQLALDGMRRKGKRTPHHVKIEAELVIRGSTGPLI